MLCVKGDRYAKTLEIARYSRVYYGTPGGTRTPDPLLRRQMLYPAELRAHISIADYQRADILLELYKLLATLSIVMSTELLIVL